MNINFEEAGRACRRRRHAEPSRVAGEGHASDRRDGVERHPIMPDSSRGLTQALAGVTCVENACYKPKGERCHLPRLVGPRVRAQGSRAWPRQQLCQLVVGGPLSIDVPHRWRLTENFV